LRRIRLGQKCQKGSKGRPDNSIRPLARGEAESHSSRGLIRTMQTSDLWTRCHVRRWPHTTCWRPAAAAHHPPSRPSRFLKPPLIRRLERRQALDNAKRRNQNLCMAETHEFSRVRRRSRPHHPARLARLRLEAEIYRPRLVVVTLRLTPDQIAKIDAERRIPTSTGVPSRCAVVRALVDEGMAWRKAMRPKSSGPARPARGMLFPIEI
jgi:hypothetical protein